ncbi:hypothetical protein CPter291_1369 [Collimonas pratensis]|uniref:Uncharacterized protein n=1 Tax=Collimonas pratensis TaxID=279113 RepID=A0ABM5Z3R2_9BURK|nr:hypothetical protein CPter291_1369 [Collimonas pratensis]
MAGKGQAIFSRTLHAALNAFMVRAFKAAGAFRYQVFAAVAVTVSC